MRIAPRPPVPADTIVDGALRAVAQAERHRTAAELARRFPGASAWRGDHTGHWWALARDRTGRDRLLEAPTPAALGHLLQELALAGRGFEERYSRAALRRNTTEPPHPPRPIVQQATVHSHAARRRRGWLRRLLAL